MITALIPIIGGAVTEELRNRTPRLLIHPEDIGSEVSSHTLIATA